MDEQLISGLEKLARLQLAQAERAKLTQDLERILQMIDQLRLLNTEGIEPLVYLNQSLQADRPDEIAGQVTTAEALTNAPRHDDQFFRVPKVID